MADNVKGIFGDYSPTPDLKYTTTPLQGLRFLGNTTRYEAGCSDTRCLVYDQAAVKKATYAADLVIVCLGTGIMFYSKITVSMASVGVVYFHSFPFFEFSIYPDRSSRWVCPAEFECFKCCDMKLNFLYNYKGFLHLCSSRFESV